jgi:hypothetical protein
MPASPEIHPIQRRAGLALLGVYVAVVAMSGFAWPLGRGHLSVFPFNRGWWMFHREDGYLYHLRFSAVRADGRLDEVDMERWFRWQASPRTRRYDETTRDRAPLRRLVAWICNAHNRESVGSNRWQAITVTDTVWFQTRGKRVSYAETPSDKLRVTTLLDTEPCRESVQ